MGSDVTMVDSTISSNASSGDGGGLSLVMSSSDSIVRSTISGISAMGHGGGLITDSGAGSEVAMFNVTIANNTADDDHNNSGDGGGIYNQNGARVYMQNSIMATNIDGSTAGSMVPDCSGALESGAFNLIGAVDGCTITGGTTGNLTGTFSLLLDPLIGMLGDNGGPTESQALLKSSTAIDAANPAGCTDLGAMPLPEDQRWWTRHIDGDLDGTATCDIGAYEKTIDLFLPLIMR